MMMMMSSSSSSINYMSYIMNNLVAFLLFFLFQGVVCFHHVLRSDLCTSFQCC